MDDPFGILANKAYKGGDIQKSLSNLPGFVWSKYPGEKHLPGHNYTGPGTRLDLRLERGEDDQLRPKPGEEPINRVDAASFRHDLAYSRHSDIASRHEADRLMIAELDAIQNPTLRERIERALVKKMLQTKLMLGQGLDDKLTKEEIENIFKEHRKQRPQQFVSVKVFGKDHIWSIDLIKLPPDPPATEEERGKSKKLKQRMLSVQAENKVIIMLQLLSIFILDMDGLFL